MSSIDVIVPGMLSSVQDLGRPGHQHMGVPISGAFDRNAFLLGNALLGNEDSDAAIEMTMIGGTYRFLADSRVCLTGAHAHHATISIGEQQQPVPHQHVVQVPRGSVISIGPLLEGVRAYLCVSGGIQTPSILGSRSALVSLPDAGLGRPLCAGDLLPISEPINSDTEGVRVEVETRDLDFVRLVESQHTDKFSAEQKQQLVSSLFRVSLKSNRAGVRLEHCRIGGTLPTITESVGTLPGYVQVPNSGEPIVLGVDGPTTGGYPVIACVIEADLPKLAQARPNDQLEFGWIRREEIDA